MSNSLYMFQTYCVKYRVNTFWCQLDKRSYNQALLYFISNARVIVYSIIIDINADRLYQTRKCLRIRSNVHERKEKMNRRRLLLYLPGPAQPEAENCEPVYSPPLDYLRNCKPPVPCAFDSRRKLSLTAIVALAPCHIRAEAICADGLSLYSFSTWNSHAIIMI